MTFRCISHPMGNSLHRPCLARRCPQDAKPLPQPIGESSSCCVDDAVHLLSLARLRAIGLLPGWIAIGHWCAIHLVTANSGCVWLTCAYGSTTLFHDLPRSPRGTDLDDFGRGSRCHTSHGHSGCHTGDFHRHFRTPETQEKSGSLVNCG
ncbi:hypothetical protein DAEQUDRAFT_425621 [Daedalea quercina L-15889]|uniref:Uncharacterized protein n=1 Tax=Daedalea quercina L-15889 TaxID=1314783 RepID=A0A165NH90_9APHY|nr:hypothetical protein DAEQUDRAFT_425621 [Daedalea quercina L-15889]